MFKKKDPKSAHPDPPMRGAILGFIIACIGFVLIIIGIMNLIPK